MRLRTKLLATMVLITAGLTSTSLLLVRRLVEDHLRKGLLQDTRNSVAAFRNAQAQRQSALRNAAVLMADLPILRAMMTSADPMTIQDASGDLFRLVASGANLRASADLLVLADGNGVVMGLHNTGAEFPRRRAHDLVIASLQNPAQVSWWYGADRLYEVAIQPIYFGSAGEQHLLGYLFLGNEIDDRVARELKQVAASEVAFFAGDAGDQVVRSTMPASMNTALVQDARSMFDAGGSEFRVGDERYLVTGVELGQGASEPVHLVVLKSLRDANDFVHNLDRILVGLGAIAIVGGGMLVLVIGKTFTRPLDRLVAGVRALGTGDYEYPLAAHGQDEVAEVTTAFDRMRKDLRTSQRELLDAERLVTIGRMASSISHDLRHHLVAIMANAEYLSDSRREAERKELCDELRISASQMTDMIDSLLELSRPRESLRISEVLIREVVGRAVHTVLAHPEFSRVAIEITGNDLSCRIDAGKVQRMLQNLVINACEAVRHQDNGRVTVAITSAGATLLLRVSDNGRGIPLPLRDSVFEPFVSDGKENGTGLGLTVVQKIVTDHGGNVAIEATSSYGTTIVVSLPSASPAPLGNEAVTPAH